jgi:hypothetical protein
MRRSVDSGDTASSYRAVGGADAPLALAEVRQLWWFLDGSIMNPDTRRHLWRSWGFCSRHTWAHAVVECELRVQPFSTAILYEDLTARAARALARPGPAALASRRLTPRAACLTCDYLTLPSAGSNPELVERWRRANRLERTRELLAVSRATWLPRSCPACAGGAGPTCRPHLLAEPAAIPARRELAGELAALSRRLYLLVKSMGWQGPARTPELEAAWVEALGWFAGWGFPVRLSVQPGAGAEGL